MSIEGISQARGQVDGFPELWDAILESVKGDRKKARYKVYASLRKFNSK